jgi:hypothetical protein
MARIATIPMNAKAVQAANEEFYKNHPEMVRNSERIPIDVCNPAHAKFQKEWMDRYIKYGGNVRIGKMQKQCGDPVEPCSCNGRLEVYLRCDRSKNPVPKVQVEIYGPTEAQKQADNQGMAVFENLPSGRYQIEAFPPNSEYAAEQIAQVECLKTSGVVLNLSVYRSLKISVINALKQEFVQGANVLVVDTSKRTKSRDKTTGKNGEVVFEALGASTYDIKVIKEVMNVKNLQGLHEKLLIVGATSRTLSEEISTVELKAWPVKKVPVKWHQKIKVSNLAMGTRTHQVKTADIAIKEYDFVREDFVETLKCGDKYNLDTKGWDSYSYEQDCLAVFDRKEILNFWKDRDKDLRKGWYIIKVLFSQDTEQEIRVTTDKGAKTPAIEELFERFRDKNE